MRSHFASVLAITALLNLAGCSAPAAEASAQATDYLLVSLEETGAPESCEFKQTSTIAKSAGIYMLEFDRHASGKGKFFSQMKFTGHDGVDYVRDETASGVLSSGPCASYDIVWRKLKCKSVERGTMDCPEIRFAGGDIFRSITIEP